MKNNLTYPITQSLKIIMALAVLTFSPVIAQPKQILAFTFAPIKAQTERIITGEIIEQQSGEPVPFANLALFEFEDSKLISGGTTNLDGRFELEFSSHGNLQLRISAVGFETVYKDIEFINHAPMDIGTIHMVEEEINLAGVVVAAERIKAISGIEKTSYMVNRNMLSASNTGTDLLKLVPGISVDIRQNISLEGNQNIMILVNGMERDRDFVAQIPATRIDKIEVSSQPSSRYDASVSGVINIILVKEKDAGFEGQIYLEVPTSGVELYLFPKYNFRYGKGRVNLFTSYNGELSRLDVIDSYQREIFGSESNQQISSIQDLTQKTWSHRFHYGMDFIINEKNQLNVYGFYNPFSFEYNGTSNIFLNGGEKAAWNVEKKDQDINHSLMNSLFYRHLFDQTKGHELTADLSIYNLRGENSSTLSNEETGYFHQNRTMPAHTVGNLKLDYTLPLSNLFKLEAGLQTRLQQMHDESNADFNYGENTFAGYGLLSYQGKKLHLQAGVRLEKSELGQQNTPEFDFYALLPNVAINYRVNSAQNLRFSYRQSVWYPRYYQLNPFQTLIDPFTLHAGNPELKPVIAQNIHLEHSIRFGNQFFSSRLFYNSSKDAVNQLNVIKKECVLESSNFHLRNVEQYGVQLTGAFSLGKKTGFNPVLRVFEVNSVPNAFGLENSLKASRKMAWHAGISAYTMLPGAITASLVFNYSSPVPELQLNRFSDALYFLSIEKDFGKGFRAGLISAIPFAGSFAYKGTDIKGSGFFDYSTGEIIMSKIPIWFKINYQFSSGQKRQAIERQREEIESIQRRGF
jgi:hypothetical protein